MEIKIGIEIEINFKGVWKLEIGIFCKMEIEIGW